MKKTFLAVAFTIATVISFAAPVSTFSTSAPLSATSTAQIANPFEDIPILNSLGEVVGTIDITGFIVRRGQLLAQAVLTTASGATANLLFPVTNVTSSCTILTLDLGPLFLNLLGLQVDLAPINLDITAVPGGGQLLGNLLCAVANLLNPNQSGLVTQIAGLLNQILGAL